MKHSSYAQWIFQLGFPANDPIVELASEWAAGVKPGARTIKFAYLSAERWTESRDKKLRSAARSIMNKLAPLVKAAESAEQARQFVYPERSLTGQPRSNPRRRRRSRRNCGNDPRYATTKIIRKGGRKNPRSRSGASVRPPRWVKGSRDHKLYKIHAKRELKRILTEEGGHKSYKRHLLRHIGGRTNPWIKFKAKGKRVKFWAKKRRSRKGRTPRHLIPYLFKKGHRPANARRRSGRGRRR